MKRYLKLIVTSLTFLVGLSSVPAHASDWGCQVLLCLSNPQGPTAVGECVPPIEKLWSELAKGHSFPSCDMSDGNDGSSHAQPVINAYDPCPTGTIDAAQGANVVQGSKINGGGYGVNGFNFDGQVATSQPNQCDGDGGCNAYYNQGPKACIGNLIGSYHVGGYNGDDLGYDVGVYDQVVWMQPQSPNAIDIYIDNALFKRVHY